VRIMNTTIAAVDAGDAIELAIAYGDLSKLTPEQRNRRYLAVCKSLGLNPLTRPFEYIVLNGKLVEYCTRAGADQLRMIHQISIEIVSQNLTDGILTIHSRAKTPDGRIDEDFGVISLPDHIKADIRANFIMKGITKAKRRVTLSICGLGWLDETEIEDIPDDAKKIEQVTYDASTATLLADAAEGGMNSLQLAWKSLTKEKQKEFEKEKDERFKPRAKEVDAQFGPETS
jgi:hypothetical protein